MNPFELLVQNLNELGFFGFLLPWIFVFALVFALLLKAKLTEDKKIIGVLSLVIAFFVVGYGGPALGNFFVNIFGMAAVVLAGILVILIFVAMSGADVTKLANKEIAAVLVAVGVVLFIIALGSMGVSMNNDVMAAVFLVIVMAIAVMFIAKNS